MEIFGDIPKGAVFVDHKTGVEYVKLNAHEAHPITGPFGGYDDTAIQFASSDEVNAQFVDSQAA